MNLNDAVSILGVAEGRIKHFKVKDPYNPWELEGYISTSEQLYGSMVICKIDNYLTEQVVIGTPKQHYPFDRLGRFKFPTAKSINIYEKYDGTNILGYCYRIKKQNFVTYKTRLTPVLTQSVWGNWKELWDEMLMKYPKLAEMVKDLTDRGINPSFELYGSRNKHLIEYKIPLDVAFLFGIKNDVEKPEIIDPLSIGWGEGLPTARLEVSVDDFSDLYSWYQKLRNQQESLNKFTEEGFIEGSEGFVWYLQDINRKVHQYKNKPESIEAIHWAAGISKNAIATTVINAYEMTNDVTYEVVKELLREEFDEGSIETKKDIILRVMSEVKVRIVFRQKVLDLYHDLNLDLKVDKAGTMRALSHHFDRKQMHNVFSTLSLEVK